MTDSTRTSASTDRLTKAASHEVEHGTPVGHPTPTGEPDESRAEGQRSGDARSDVGEFVDQPDLFPGAPQVGPLVESDAALLQAVGKIILAWGHLERTTADKVSGMREAFGDVRTVGGRTRPTMQKLLAELRALVAMRDRHDKEPLAVIASIDGNLQRIAQFRQLIVDGAQNTSGKVLHCRDIKNCEIEIGLRDIEREAALLDRICAQILDL